ncbi:MAG: potassium channel family protein, partial [Ktedonobacterales bacterium]
MTVIAAIFALVLIVTVLWDAFETIILPRRVRRRLRLTRVIYRLTWMPWSAFARRLRGVRETALSLYGPLALLLLLAIWAVMLILGFGLLQWALGSRLISPVGHTTFGTDLYMSGTTFFTLGLGDVVPVSTPARAITVVESGTGFAFLALVIGYLPILYQAFSRREVVISLLDARAGSPPTAAELLRRNAERGSEAALTNLLADWERWSAELLESHLSYPSLGYFRSQHENQSWLASLTAILDVCALVLTGVEELPKLQARLTFAMARHAAVDLSQVFGVVTRGVK